MLTSPPDSDATIECIDRSLLLLHELSNAVREENLSKSAKMSDEDDLMDDHTEPLRAYMSIDYDNH